jgi:hypothetical protein
MSKPNEGFDLDSYDFTEYASALDGDNPSSTDCDMESESQSQSGLTIIFVL